MAQVWLVTGSSRGLGHAIVEAGLAAGNKGLATARDIKSLANLSERYGDQVKLFAMDVTDEAAAASDLRAAVDVFGSLDVVINKAGYGNLSSVEDTPLSAFRAQIETNLFGTIIVTKAALRYFREKKAGQFIQFSSVGGRIGPPGRGPYSAAKWGVEGFSEVLSREVAPLGIKVTIVEPGGFRTDFAGSSTELSEGHPEYDSTVGATARFQRNYNGKQPGDPNAAGVQFEPVHYNGQTFLPGQANNFYIFPAVGMAIYATQAKRVTDEMFIEAGQAVADQVPSDLLNQGLLYPLQSNILETEIQTAARVAKLVFDSGLARVERPADMVAFIREHVYKPEYKLEATQLSRVA